MIPNFPADDEDLGLVHSHLVDREFLGYTESRASLQEKFWGTVLFPLDANSLTAGRPLRIILGHVLTHHTRWEERYGLSLESAVKAAPRMRELESFTQRVSASDIDRLETYAKVAMQELNKWNAR